VLLSGLASGEFDQVFVGAECNVFHGNSVHEIRVTI